MEILHVVPSFSIGGMEKIICAFINATARNYHHSIVSLDNTKDAMEWIKVENNVDSINFFKPPERMSFFRALYRLLYKNKPDILMTYNWGATDAVWLGRLAGIKRIIHHEHGFNIDETKYTSRKRDFLRCFIYRLASLVVVVSHDLQKMMAERYYLKDDRVVLVQNGIDTDYYVGDILAKKHMREVLGFKEEDFVVVFSGRLDPVKNFDFMLEVFTCCVEKDSDFKLLIVGDGEEKHRITSIIEEKNIQRHVSLAGKHENILPFLQAADAFLLTSLREQMPLTILEAMSAGLPVVASAVGEIPSIVDHKENGFCCRLDEQAETFAMYVLALKDVALRTRMRRLAREKVVKQYRECVMVERYCDIIANLR